VGNSLFEKYGRAETLAPSFIWGLACCKAGIPTFLVAPPSGGKSTVIFALQKWLTLNHEPVKLVSRLNLRGMKQLNGWFKKKRYATILNEDYALIGSSDYIVEKMGEIIGSLSYSGVFVDDGLGVNIKVDRLGFVSGIQPLWIENLVKHPVYATFIREKFLRYYLLPYKPSEDIDDLEAQNILVQNTKTVKTTYDFEIPSIFISGLAFQVGLTRAKMYAPRIAREICRFVGKEKIEDVLKFYSYRLRFEQLFLTRELGDKGFDVSVNWEAYHVLYWALRVDNITRIDLMTRLGVSSLRSVERATNKAIALGWISYVWNGGEKHFIPNRKLIGGE